jgi:hypothetical protein
VQLVVLTGLPMVELLVVELVAMTVVLTVERSGYLTVASMVY